MEEHPECHFCVCGVQEVNVNKQPLGIFHPCEKIENSFISPDDLVKYAATYSFQTSSYLMRYDDWKDYVLNPPDFRRVSDIGDLPIMLYFGSLGETIYINKIMSCYRRGAPSSYSAKKNNWDADNKKRHFEKQVNVWKYFDAYSHGKYHKLCSKKISQNLFGQLILQSKAKEFLKEENRDYFDALTIGKKIYVLLGILFSNIIRKHYIATMNERENKEMALWEGK